MLGRSSRVPRTSTWRSTSRSARVRECLLGARVVALPVRENTYSGATTTLLQAMACGKPVVVTRTAAIARGYHLEDGVNCRLVAPGDLAALEQAVTGVLDDPRSRPASACRARETVERHLTWARIRGRDPPPARRRRRPDDGSRHDGCAAVTARARRASRQRSRARSRRRSTASAMLVGEARPIWRSSTTSRRRRRAVATSSCGRSSRELERRGLAVEVNRISAGTTACLFNSFNFDFRRLRRFARDDVRFVHRVDGPIGDLPRVRRRNGRANRRDQPTSSPTRRSCSLGTASTRIARSGSSSSTPI